MLKKTLFIVSIFVLCQIASSCLFLGSCPNPSTFELIYNSTEIKAQNISGFYAEDYKDSVPKNAFGVTIYVNFEATQIAQNTNFMGSFGFSSCYALSCDGDTYTYPDDIKNLDIYATNTVDSVKWNASHLFATKDYNKDEMISLKDYMLQRPEGVDGFQFELVQYDSIPDSVIFTVEVELESGIIFEDETPEIKFY